MQGVMPDQKQAMWQAARCPCQQIETVLGLTILWNWSTAAGGAAVTATTTRTMPTPTKTATKFQGERWCSGIFNLKLDCKVIVCKLYIAYRSINDLSYNCICTINQLIIHNCSENTSFYLMFFLYCLFDFASNQWIRCAFLWKQTWNWISKFW